MPKQIDLTGEKFGRLTVLKFSHRNSNRYLWLCECECGNTCTVERGNLRKGHTQSCGCYQKDQIIKALTTHGQSGYGYRTIEYTTWVSIIQRCGNPKAKRYKDWGGRGIKICSWYKTSFENFLNSLGKKPSLEHSIDRIDNDKNYSCGHCQECISNGWKMNVRWATEEQQVRGKRNNRWLTNGMDNLILTDWAKKINVKIATLHKYLKTHTFEEALIHYSK